MKDKHQHMMHVRNEPQEAVVGFSVNPELELAVENTLGPKKVLKRMNCCVSGSSGNVKMALNKLGGRSHLFGLVAAGPDTFADKLLGEAIDRRGVAITPLRVLAETNICVIPIMGNMNGVAWGKRNRIVQSAVPKALQRLTRVIDIVVGTRTFSVITSLRSVEAVFATTLLARTSPGFRVLNAKDSLCSRREFKEILPLVDLLVLNQREFEETGMEISELHKCGPRIVVVTHDRKGGMFSLNSGHQSRFKRVDFPGGRFETGAGDWFLGALVSELIRLRESVLTIKPRQFHRMIDFAARVAGKKITMPGGGNGPTRSQLRN